MQKIVVDVDVDLWDANVRRIIEQKYQYEAHVSEPFVYMWLCSQWADNTHCTGHTHTHVNQIYIDVRGEGEVTMQDE